MAVEWRIHLGANRTVAVTDRQREPWWTRVTSDTLAT
jgi:hypothetical protein